MQAEILATGDELRSGALVDTNSAYIATKLEEIGIRIIRHITVGDDLKILIDIFQEAGQRADIVIVTGGLGPTRDDLSRDAAAQTVGDELLLDNTSLAEIENFFVARQRPMPASNCRQAMFPASAEVLPNPVGTAPGFVIKIGQARFFFLPGVPPEMKKMLTNEVLPRIRQLGRDEHCYRTETITTFGIGESSLEERVEEFYDRFPKIKLGFRAHFPEVQLKLYLKGSNEIELDRQREQAVAWLRTELKHKIVSLEGKSLPRVVGDLLLEQEATLAVAESCTGGLIADWLTDRPGSSGFFLLSAVTYANTAKERILGVPAAILEKEGAVSEACVAAMAQGVRERAGATFGLATSGIAGPDGGTPEKPVGTIYIGLAGPNGVETRRYQFPFRQRLYNKKLFAAQALNRLRLKLTG
jgi:nicotinamide-nucleotide amidase